MRPLKGLTPRAQRELPKEGSEEAEAEVRKEKGEVGGGKVEEEKEGAVPVISESVVAVALPPVSMGRRGSGTRPVLPPIRVARPSSVSVPAG